MYHNIEKRLHAVTQMPEATHRGWDAAGKFWFVGRGGKRGNLWWAVCRDQFCPNIYGATLREISSKLAHTGTTPAAKGLDL